MMTQASMSESHELADPTDRSPDNKVAPAADEPNDHVDQSRAVLIVEDDFLIAMQAEAALLDAGFRVTGIATTAEEALTMAREQKPALAIMDIRLAGRRDGVEAAGDLFRELGLRCVFATAHDDLLTRTRAEPFAPLGWLSKPYTMASLTSVVRASLTRPA
jgi:DNA-binding response OmpR family regulator